MTKVNLRQPFHEADNLRKIAQGLLLLAEKLDSGALRYKSGGIFLNVGTIEQHDVIPPISLNDEARRTRGRSVISSAEVSANIVFEMGANA